jgi:outer membrane protein TolC
MRPAACIAVAVFAPILLAASPRSAAETLEAAWIEALACNPQLAAIAFDASAAQEDLEAARLQRRPNAWVRSSYAVRSDESSFRFDNPFAPGQTFTEPFRQREGAGAAAAVSVPIYAGGRISNSIGGAAARLTAANQATAMSRMVLLLDVGEAFVAVLRSQRQLEVARQNLHGLQAHQEEVQRHFDQRQVPQTDLLAAQVATATAQQVELRRRHQIEAARGEYNRLLGRPLDASVALEEISMPPLPYNFEELKGVGLQKRPDLAELQAAADFRRFEAERLKAAVRPQVSAIGRHDFEENRYQTPQGIASAAVVVEWNLYDGGQSNRASSAEFARAASLMRQADDLRSRVALDILHQWNYRHESSSRLQVALQAVQHADENLRVSQLRFAQGTTTSSEVLDAQTQRSQVASDLYDAAYDCCLAGIRLRYAAGILGNGE